MSVLLQSHSFLRGHFWLLLGACLSLYFCYHAIAGQRSLSRLMHVNAALDDVAVDLAAAQGARLDVEARVVMLRPGSLNLDYVEELAVSQLGYSGLSEIAVMASVE